MDMRDTGMMTIAGATIDLDTVKMDMTEADKRTCEVVLIGFMLVVQDGQVTTNKTARLCDLYETFRQPGFNDTYKEDM